MEGLDNATPRTLIKGMLRAPKDVVDENSGVLGNTVRKQDDGRLENERQRGDGERGSNSGGRVGGELRDKGEEKSGIGRGTEVFKVVQPAHASETPRTIIRNLSALESKSFAHESQDATFGVQVGGKNSTMMTKPSPREQSERSQFLENNNQNTPRALISQFVSKVPSTAQLHSRASLEQKSQGLETPSSSSRSPRIGSGKSWGRSAKQQNKMGEQNTLPVIVVSAGMTLQESGNVDDQSEFFATTESDKQPDDASSRNLDIGNVSIGGSSSIGDMEEETGPQDPFEMLDAQANLYQRASKQHGDDDEVPLARKDKSTPALVKSSSRRSSATSFKPDASTPVFWDQATPQSEPFASVQGATSVQKSNANLPQFGDSLNTMIRREPSPLNLSFPTPSLLPNETLLNGSVLERRMGFQERKAPPPVPLFDAKKNVSRVLRGRKMQKRPLPKKKTETTSKMQRTTNDSLPDVVVKRLWTNMLKTSTLGSSNNDKETLEAVQSTCKTFFKRAAEELKGHAEDAGRCTIRIGDACKLLRSHQVIDDNPASLLTVVNRCLPREHADRLIGKIKQ